MIERRRRPFGRNFLLDTAAILLEKTVPFARIFSRNKATNYHSVFGVARSSGNDESAMLGPHAFGLHQCNFNVNDTGTPHLDAVH